MSPPAVFSGMKQIVSKVSPHFFWKVGVFRLGKRFLNLAGSSLIRADNPGGVKGGED